ncbi:hypothetical protein BG53_00530 [Paenibacillus darwinianus]|uniref:TVP38/TMEM64 family membrane protein n=1 Tax=Paenibacillus darwinianus TaxID=1380763 RepID=A0A9W5W799_9BACL|nr:VTT domain-containing protein [Paenibacillus darwinianus]EXX89165.1 hypothetical protein BG53_00530 [Paenibacillus darwinianus]EXX89544.1 hypothetical protein BG52_15350 [Paenibacillus darwinianus]EXX89745.1 hypothetical protein CH50_00950 [Paenibacillus darwinianus]
MDWLVKVEQLAAWLREFGIWAIAVSLLLSIAVAILGLVPSVFISGANAVVFGIVPGFWISLAGEVLGAAISYWLYKWGFGKTRLKQDNWSWLRRLNEGGRPKQFSILAFARLTPVPSGVITFVAAISSMRYIDFLLATTLGKMPSIAMETLIGHDLFTINENLPRLLVVVSVVIVVYLLFRGRNKKKG